MKILYHHRTRAVDAQGVHIFEMVNAFRALGHTVDVAALVSDERPRAEVSATTASGRKRTLPWLNELVQLGYNFVGVPMLLAKLRGGSYDFIYERYSLFNFAGILAAWAARRPIIIEVNSPLALEQHREGTIRWHRLAKWAERVVCNSATNVLVVSTPLARIMAETGVAISKLRLMPNGADTAKFKRDWQADSLRASLGLAGSVVAGFAGWFRPWHGLELLLEAFDSAGLGNRAKLLLIGDGPAMPALRESVERRRLSDRVVFSGPVPHDEIPRYLSVVDIAVQPAANEYCCPMKILEYMALGKAIVAPRQPNILDLLDDSDAVLFTPLDALSLGRALSVLVTDADRRDRLGRAARQTIDRRRFLWSENARRVIEIVKTRHDGRSRTEELAKLA